MNIAKKDLQKYITELKNNGAPYCFADTSSGRYYVKDAYSPVLLMHLKYDRIVTNDIAFDKNGIFVHILTGANSGGKSVYIQTIGIVQILFQLGLCICKLSCKYRSRRSCPDYRNIVDHNYLTSKDCGTFLSPCRRTSQ